MYDSHVHPKRGRLPIGTEKDVFVRDYATSDRILGLLVRGLSRANLSSRMVCWLGTVLGMAVLHVQQTSRDALGHRHHSFHTCSHPTANLVVWCGLPVVIALEGKEICLQKKVNLQSQVVLATCTSALSVEVWSFPSRASVNAEKCCKNCAIVALSRVSALASPHKILYTSNFAPLVWITNGGLCYTFSQQALCCCLQCYTCLGCFPYLPESSPTS